MKTLFKLLVIALLLCIGPAGCVSSNTPIHVSARVGPMPDQGAHDNGIGKLQVFSSTEEHEEDALYYYPHSSYTIHDASGQRIKYVRNHTDYYDETPTMVSLPPGEYSVRAQADGRGVVEVPVVIESGRTTPLHLERARRN